LIADDYELADQQVAGTSERDGKATYAKRIPQIGLTEREADIGVMVVCWGCGPLLLGGMFGAE